MCDVIEEAHDRVWPPQPPMPWLIPRRVPLTPPGWWVAETRLSLYTLQLALRHGPYLFLVEGPVEALGEALWELPGWLARRASEGLEAAQEAREEALADLRDEGA